VETRSASAYNLLTHHTDFYKERKDEELILCGVGQQRCGANARSRLCAGPTQEKREITGTYWASTGDSRMRFRTPTQLDWLAAKGLNECSQPVSVGVQAHQRPA